MLRRRVWILILETFLVFCPLLITDCVNGRSSIHIQFKLFQGRYGLCDSNILNGNEKFIAMLSKWLSNKTTWTLCYRGSIHGWKMPDNFHPKCDGKGATVTIVSVEDGKYIFGGYSDISWGIGFGYVSSSSAFLFSLRNKDGLEPFMCPIRHGQENLALYQVVYYGPSFGNQGNELGISGKPKSISCSANLGVAYMLPFGYTSGSAQAKTLLGGSESFFPSEIETYYLNI